MSEVFIVGGGIAGLTVALRLLQRGFKITLLEQDDFLGGKLGAHQHIPSKEEKGFTGQRTDGLTFISSGGRDRMVDWDLVETAPAEGEMFAEKRDKDTDWHEHSYHMYLNWYHNFWNIIDEIGQRARFVPVPTARHLHPLRKDQRQPGKPIAITNVGSPLSFWKNLYTGLMSPADMFLYGYSLLDVIATPERSAKQLDRTSVLDFLSSRPYTTQNAVDQHYRTLANAFACPSYLTAMRSYKAFIKYGARQPSPMMWLLETNAQRGLFKPLEKHLRDIAKKLQHQGLDKPLDIRPLSFVKSLGVKRGKVVGLEILTLEESPSVDSRPIKVKNRQSVLIPEDADVVLAVPPKALQSLVSPDVLEIVPRFGDVSKLRSLPMASLDLYFNKRLKGVPEGITLLLDSRYTLSFLDVSQLWPELKVKEETALNIIASDVGILATYPDEVVIKLMCEELKRYIPFDDADVDKDRALLQTNLGEELFINQVGSWDSRPTATCAIPNLFIAGDYCQTCIDVVTIEGAVVSGLLAAEAVRERRGIGAPIEIIEPPSYSEASLALMKACGAPWAYAAKAVAELQDVMLTGYRRVFPNG
ncbi:MAG: FAD-dependent oxidoreductase [Rhodopila sp.]